MRLVNQVLHHSDFDSVADHIVIEAPLAQEVSSINLQSDLLLHRLYLLLSLLGLLVGFYFFVCVKSDFSFFESEDFGLERVFISELTQLLFVLFKSVFNLDAFWIVVVLQLLPQVVNVFQPLHLLRV